MNGKEREIMARFNPIGLELTHKLLSREQVTNLVVVVQNSDEDPNVRISAMQKIVTSNMRLVMHCITEEGFVERARNVDMGLLDLMHEGVFGIMRAAEKVDLEKGEFSTYASWWIRQTISRAIDNGGTIRVPVWAQSEIGRIQAARKDLEQELERPLTLEQANQKVDDNMQEGLLASVRVAQTVVSLDKPLFSHEDDSLTLFDRYENNVSGSDSPEQTFLKKEQRRTMARILTLAQKKSIISPHQRELLMLYYGGFGLVWREIGKIYNPQDTTRGETERAQAQRALRKLRAFIQEHPSWRDAL